MDHFYINISGYSPAKFKKLEKEFNRLGFKKGMSLTLNSKLSHSLITIKEYDNLYFCRVDDEKIDFAMFLDRNHMLGEFFYIFNKKVNDYKENNYGITVEIDLELLKRQTKETIKDFL